MQSFPGPAHAELAAQGERPLAKAAELISKGERCGLDCTQFREGYTYIRSFLDNFKREFFPDQIVPPDGSGYPRTPN